MPKNNENNNHEPLIEKSIQSLLDYSYTFGFVLIYFSGNGLIRNTAKVQQSLPVQPRRHQAGTPTTTKLLPVVIRKSNIKCYRRLSSANTRGAAKPSATVSICTATRGRSMGGDLGRSPRPRLCVNFQNVVAYSIARLDF